MYIRSTTIQGDPSKIDEGIAYLHGEVMQALDTLEGSLGLSMLVDRQSGRCVVYSAWASEETMSVSNEALTGLREKGGRILGAAPVVEEWELAGVHRMREARDGDLVRTTRVRIDPADAERAVETWRTTSAPAMELLPGFCGAILLLNRATGDAVSTAMYDGSVGLAASREQAQQQRAMAADKAHAQVVEVAEFELAIAGIRMRNGA